MVVVADQWQSGQGIGVIHGSFMTGRHLYLALGLMLLLIGILLLVGSLAVRGRGRSTLP